MSKDQDSDHPVASGGSLSDAANDGGDTEALRTALGQLIAACNEANAAATQQLGGVVIPFPAMSAAQRAFDGSVCFCGGWPNALTAPLWPENKEHLTWET